MMISRRMRHFLIFAGFFALLGILYVSLPISSPTQDVSTPIPSDAVYKNEAMPLEERIDDLLGRMTLEEKIGQMALVEKDSVKRLSDITTYGLGGVLSGGGAKPDINTPQGWKNMVSGFVSAASSSRTGIPLLYGADANHGNGNIPGATIFPHAIGLGATGDPMLVEAIARATALESSAVGIRWHFSPDLDLPRDIRWGRVYEAFSSDSTLTARLGAAYVRGIQSIAGTDERVVALATPKHYLGVGSMLWGTAVNPDYRIDQGRTPADERALRKEYLPPFEAAIEAGALSIMAGLNSWGDTKLSASKYLLTNVLKRELKFKGFVVSDWYGVYEVAPNKYDALVLSINAGVDMIMLPFEYRPFVSYVRRAVLSGDISESRIDDAVRRILRAKFSLGLFDEDPSAVPPLSVIGSEPHRALARQAVIRSMVLLQNKEGTLPLSPRMSHIRVAGSSAHDIGRQSGGWTVEWQGIEGNGLKGGTSILDGIKAIMGHARIEYAKNGVFKDKSMADVGIAVVGERPYSEGVGDTDMPILSDDDLNAIKALQKNSSRVVVVIISGRPLLISNEVSSWDALVAAWLPGSEGGVVASQLFGKEEWSGTLPLPWPRMLEQLPIGADGRTRDGTQPLFPFGFGLR